MVLFTRLLAHCKPQKKNTGTGWGGSKSVVLSHTVLRTLYAVGCSVPSADRTGFCFSAPGSVPETATVLNWAETDTQPQTNNAARENIRQSSECYCVGTCPSTNVAKAGREVTTCRSMLVYTRVQCILRTAVSCTLWRCTKYVVYAYTLSQHSDCDVRRTGMYRKVLRIYLMFFIAPIATQRGATGTPGRPVFPTAGPAPPGREREPKSMLSGFPAGPIRGRDGNRATAPRQKVRLEPAVVSCWLVLGRSGGEPGEQPAPLMVTCLSAIVFRIKVVVLQRRDANSRVTFALFRNTADGRLLGEHSIPALPESEGPMVFCSSRRRLRCGPT